MYVRRLLKRKNPGRPLGHRWVGQELPREGWQPRAPILGSGPRTPQPFVPSCVFKCRGTFLFLSTNNRRSYVRSTKTTGAFTQAGGGRGLGLFNQQATREKGQCYTTSCIRVNGHLHPHVFQTTQASLVDRHHPPATLRSLRCRTFLVIPLKHSLAYSLERCSCRAHNQQRPRTLLLLSGRARTRNSSTKHRQLQKTYNKLDAVSFVACRVAR